MIAIGNFFFRFRNGLFPALYLLLFIPAPRVFFDFRAAAFLGLVFAFVGQALRAATIGFDYIIRGGRNRRVYAEGLVTGGMFSCCRNPLYVGNFLIIFGLGIASNSRFFLACIIPLFAFIYWTIIAAEENFLLGKFGDGFRDYCVRVNRLIPNLKHFGEAIAGMKYNWRRLITAEYGSTYIWIVGMLGVTIQNAIKSNHYSAKSPLLIGLSSGVIVATILYLTARVLKKSGFLNAPPMTPVAIQPQAH